MRRDPPQRRVARGSHPRDSETRSRLARRNEDIGFEACCVTSPSVRVRKRPDAALIDGATGRETLEAEVRGDRMRIAAGDEMRRRHPTGGNRFESAVAPAAIQD